MNWRKLKMHEKQIVSMHAFNSAKSRIFGNWPMNEIAIFLISVCIDYRNFMIKVS